MMFPDDFLMKRIHLMDDWPPKIRWMDYRKMLPDDWKQKKSHLTYPDGWSLTRNHYLMHPAGWK